MTVEEGSPTDLAIVGMAGRFPGAADVEQLWTNVRDGVESIRPFSDEELERAGVTAATRTDPRFVNAGAVMDDPDCFDASFFGITPREAEIMDPQHRVMLECAWTALEHAGYAPTGYPGVVGVFGGVAENSYYKTNVSTYPGLLETMGRYPTLIGSEREFAVTRISYKLDLTGPSLSVNTACSTSAVALHLACQSLLAGECDAAVVGGARIHVPLTAGYLYQEEGILSPDGHCRAFDAEARGTVIGNGVAVVVIKRLADADRDCDTIHAIVKGTAVNNDGADKIGFAAPGVRGQSAVVREALDVAGVEASTIGYVEAHGTGTFIGDPIEVAALTRAHRLDTDATGYCRIGSLKTNLGHLDAAAGVAGVIKAVLALEHAEIPPTLNFTTANPQIDFAATPFVVNDRLTRWSAGRGPRRAAVSSFGLGGTNAHIILEEAPPAPPPVPSAREHHLFLLSAQTEASVERSTVALADHLDRHPQLDPADVAHTLALGRSHHARRRSVVARDREAAARALRATIGRPLREVAGDRPVVFAFPGGGVQHAGMGRRLYATEPEFRRWFDRCAELAERATGCDLHRLVFHTERGELERPAAALPALFACEYATARLLESLGVRPDLVIGHSLGEYTAACVAGVMTLPDAMKLVTTRGELFETLPPGVMLSVPLPAVELKPLLGDDLSIAVINQPDLCIVAGEHRAVVRLERRLCADGIESRRLRIAVAAHSHLVEPILERFGDVAAGIHFSEPVVPLISNLTGTQVTSEVCDPSYWTAHLRNTVRFDSGLATALSGPPKVVVEVGPGQVLSGFARQSIGGMAPGGVLVVATLPHPSETTPDDAFFLGAVGRLWEAGVTVDLAALKADEERRRVPLPTYSFDRTRHWIEAAAVDPTGTAFTPSPAVADHPPIPQGAEAEASAAAEPGGRLIRIRAQVTEVFSELSGLEATDIDPSATFFEHGFDSLFMSQAATAVGSMFGTRISFRQLFEEAPTIDALARWLEPRLPTEAAPTDHRSDAEPAVGSTPSGADRPGPWRPPELRSDDLDSDQREHITALAQRLNSRSPGSKEATQANRGVLADPRTVAGFRKAWKEIVYPVVVERSAGSKLWDVDGNEYLDVAMGFGVSLFGHSPSFVIEAVRAQLERGIEIGPQTPLAGETAALLAELTGHERVAFANTGSEAVLAAMRLARTVTGRTKILTFASDYHGVFDEVLARGISRGGSRQSVPIAPGIPDHAPQDLVIFDYADPEALRYVAEHASELAAVLVEPVQSRHPDLQPVEFLRELRRVTSRSNVALIFDEMITGFRAHPGGVQGLIGVKADLATYGKVVGGGFPIGVVAGDARFMDALDGGSWRYGDGSVPEADVTWFAGTFVRHPIALAASRATLLHLRAEGPALQADLNRRTTELVTGLNDFLETEKMPLRIEHFSSLFLLRFARDQQFSSLLYFHLRDQGIHLTEGRAAFLSTAHSDGDLERLDAACRAAVTAMASAKFLSRDTTRIGPLELPLTDGQQEILLAAAQGPKANCAYNLSSTLHIAGPVDTEVLQRSVDRLVRRHDALRVTFTPDRTGQRVAPQRPVGVSLTDLSELDPEARDGALSRLRAGEVETPFDLVDGPLLRVHLIRMTVDDHHLFLTVHHAVCDGWSSGTLLRQLTQIYTAERRGETVGVGPAVQLGDHVEWFERYRSSEAYAADGRFWAKHVAAPFPVTDLPADRPRPAQRSYRAERRERRLGLSLARDLRAVAGTEGCTLFTLLLSSFECLLHRLTGHDEIALGVSIAGHASVADRDLIAHCVNVLPLRRGVDRDMLFADHLRSTQATFLDAFDHQHFSYGAIVRSSVRGRDVSRTPLVSVVFNMDTPAEPLDMDGVAATPGSNARRYENFDAFVNVVPRGDDLIVECTYSVDLFDAGSIDRLLAAWATMLSSLSRRGGQVRVGELEVAPAEDLALLGTWNDTGTAFPDRCIHELFEDQVAAGPEAIALTAGDGGSLTYRALNERANRLAHHLRSMGVGPEVRVGICLRRSVDAVIALLATLKAGGAYLPLDPDHPAPRLLFMVEDGSVEVVVTDSVLVERLGGWPGPVVDLDRDESLIATASAADPAPRATPDTLAYVLYTSGSTGTPKGVMVEHRAVVTRLCGVEYIRFGEVRTLLHLAPLAFDASTFEIWGPLVHGCRCVIYEDLDFSVERFGAIVEAEQVDTLFLTTALFNLVVDEGASHLGAVRQLIFGGEAASGPHVARARRLLPGLRRLVNGYGPTEATTFAACYEVGSLDDEARAVPIGRPIANTECFILDAGLGSVPIGAVGELYVGGAGLARGYLNHPDLSALRFIPHPHRAGARLYRTGDLARYRSDGNLEFVGRTDDQVKIRGFRVEPGEVEAVLRRHPAVADAAVIAPDGLGPRRLVAYAVPAGPTLPPTRTLLDHLRSQLPEHLVPVNVVPLDALPLTPNGKVDRAALPGAGPAPPGSPFVAPSTETERLLASIWGEVLGLDRVGVDDDFFTVGGDSLSSAALFAKIARRTGRNIPLSLLFQGPTIRQIAGALDRQDEEHGEDQTSVVPLRVEGSKPPLFVAHGVSGLLFDYVHLLRRLDPDRAVYGLQPTDGFAGNGKRLRLEHLARRYVEDIVRLQATGPYRLAGFSFGGIVVVEVAHQLEQLGHTVAALVLFDAMPPSALPASRARREAAQLASLIRGHEAPTAYVRRRWVGAKAKAHAWPRRADYWLHVRTGRPLPDRWDTGERVKGLHTFALRQALASYVAPATNCTTTLFRAGEAGASSPAVRSCSEADRPDGIDECYVVDGPGVSHWTLLEEPHVAVLAEVLNARLDRDEGPGTDHPRLEIGSRRAG